MANFRTHLLMSACFLALPVAAQAQSTTVSGTRTTALNLDAEDTLTVNSGALFQVSGNQAVGFNGTSSGAGVVITNDGTIEGVASTASNGRGISGSTDYADRSVTILNRGLIRGGNDGIRFTETTAGGDGGTIAIDNHGSIISTGLDNGNVLTQQAQGVEVTISGVTLTLDNRAGGLISGSQGVVTSSNSTIVNAGTIVGTGAVSGQGEGIRGTNGGTLNIVNEAGGSITGIYGVIGTGDTSIVNRGAISGSDGGSSGVTLTREAIRINLSATSTNNSVTLAAGSTTSAGTGTNASGNAVVFGGSAVAGTVNRLTVETGAVINGGLVGVGSSNATDILNLTGTGAQTLGMATAFDELHVLGGDWGISNAQTLRNGATIAAGAVLRYEDAGTGGAIIGDIVNDGTLIVNRSVGVNQSGSISGSGGLQIVNAGTFVLDSANSYSGDTLVNAGRLRTGQLASSFSAHSALIVTGAGIVDLNDTGTTSVARDQAVANLSGDGAVWLGQLNGATLTTGSAGGNTEFSGVMSQLGGLTKVGTGTLTLSGNNSATGLLSVKGGRVALSGGWAGAAEVANGAALSGMGSIAGLLTVGDGSIAPGNGGVGVLSVGALALSSGSVLDYQLGAPGTGDRIAVTGDLVLDGTVNVTDIGGFGEGVYRLIDYGGALIDNGLDVGALPSGTVRGLVGVQTSVANQVNLVYGASSGSVIQFWDGAGAADNAAVEGGSGSWTNAATDWTDANGMANGGWAAGFAVFQGQAGTVSVDGAIAFTGAQFITDGYEIAAGTGALTTDTALTTLRVDPGATATISAGIGGTGGIVKSDTGTLILSGANGYQGQTNILGGTLVAQGASALPGGTDVIVAAAGTLDARTDQSIASLNGSGKVILGGTLTTGSAGDDVFSGVLSGTAGLVKTGSGTLTVGGANLHVGLTTVAAGTLNLTGSTAGGISVANGATLTGAGSAGGVVTLADGATLDVGGAGAGTFTSGGLALDAGSTLNFGLGSVSDRLQVNGDLVLDGMVNVADLGGFGIGVYRLIDYTGALTDNGLALGLLPAGVDAADVSVQTATASQVNLVYDRIVPELQFWRGGDGSWTANGADWTDANGASAKGWGGRFAVFGGQAGTVSVDGAIGFTGMQFMTDGYSIAAGSGALSVTEAQTAIRVDPGVTATISAPIGGSGGIAKLDSGTLVLNGVNGYAGATLVSGGTLRAGVAGALPTGTDVTVSAGAVLDLASSQTVASLSGGGVVQLTGGSLTTGGGTFGGTIGGVGGLTKVGSGVLTLAGANDYGGATQVQAGTLRLEGGALGTGALTVASGAVLDMNGGASTVGTLSGAGAIALGSGKLTTDSASDSSFTGVLSGAGSFAKAGTGTLTLTGANSHSGGTIVSGGRLSAGAANVFGTGTLTVNGPGTVALNTFAQTVGGLAGDGAIALGSAVLTVNGADASSYAGVLSGTGRLIKSGAGTLTLNGVNSYTGSTSVTGGKLIVNGSLAGTVTLGANAMLGGSGKIGSLNISGTVAPGNSIGTLNVGGSLTFAAGSTYAVEIAPDGTSDRIAATGSVTINGGTVAVQSGGQVNFAPLTTYTIVTGSAVTGAFGGVTSDLAFLDPTLVYSANAVQLRMLRNDVALASVAETGNQIAVANVVEAQGRGDVFDAAIGLNAANARNAFDQLSGEIWVASATVVGRDGHDAARDLIGRVDGPKGQRHLLWLSGDFSRLAADDGDGFARIKSDRRVVTGGVEMGDERLMVGLSYRHARNRVGLGGLGSADISSNAAYAYAGYRAGGFRLAGGVGYAAHSVSSDRRVAFGGLSNRVQGDGDGHSYSGFAEASYTAPLAGNLRVGPYAGVSTNRTTLDAMQEWGGAAALAVGRIRSTTVLASYGARGTAIFANGVALTADMGARSYLDNDAPTRMMRLRDSEDGFVIGAGRFGTTTLAGRVEASATAGRFLLGLGVQGESNSGATGYGVRLSGGFRF